MRILYQYCLVIALAALVGTFAPKALADPTFSSGSPVDNCSASMVKRNCKPAGGSSEENMIEGRVLPKREMVIKRSLTLLPPERPSDACDAEFSISYAQMNDKVKVDTQIKNATCAASSGEYALRVRTRDATGEVATHTYEENWSRVDDKDVTTTHTYPLDGAPDLLWVRVNAKRSSSCLCSDLAASSD